MATKGSRKEMVSGHSQHDFEIMGRAAKDQGDFGSDVGVADMACVNQFGQNSSKYYHASVVKSTQTGGWFVYLEWGRIFAGKSWDGRFNGQDFQFVHCNGEADARAFFAKQANSKNTKRLEEKVIGGATVWAGRKGKDGYIVQDLATRERGLPDAYKIKDDSGIAPATKSPAKKAPTKAAKAPTRSFQPQVVTLAQDLVGGVRRYTKALSAASGVAPTMQAIEQVRNVLIPAAMNRIKTVGNDIASQCRDNGLVDVTKMVAALVPRPIPRKGQSAEEAILSANSILSLQADLDAFESSLKNESFDVDTSAPSVDPDAMLNAALRWIDPNSAEGKWLWSYFSRMSRNRHGYLGTKPPKVKNLFAISRPDRDAGFDAAVKKVAAQRRGQFSLKANLQFPREDLNGKADLYKKANVIVGIHGTRPVNIAPIMGSNLRLPRSLPGAQITGANFGHGIYMATDWRKSYGYTGRGYYGGGGDVRNRGCFMFLCDMIMGDAYRAPRTGSWSTPPDGKDSVFGVGGDPGHRLENDEHIIFDPNYQRLSYLVEFDWLN